MLAPKGETGSAEEKACRGVDVSLVLLYVNILSPDIYLK